MTTLRLGSVIEYEFGPNTGAISLLYSYLLKKYEVNCPSNILINHIGTDLQEQIIIKKNQAAINIQYPLPNDFAALRDRKNIFFTEIIHEASVRLANETGRIEINKLTLMRQEILDKQFSFSIPYKNYINKSKSKQTATLYIKPELEKFDFIITLNKLGSENCSFLIPPWLVFPLLYTLNLTKPNFILKAPLLVFFTNKTGEKH